MKSTLWGLPETDLKVKVPVVKRYRAPKAAEILMFVSKKMPNNAMMPKLECTHCAG